MTTQQPPGARREMAEVEFWRSEAGRATESTAQIRPAIEVRAGRRLATETRKRAVVRRFFAPRSDREAQTTKLRPRRDTPSCATPAPACPTIGFWGWRARWSNGTEKCQPLQFGRQETQFTIRDVVREGR